MGSFLERGDPDGDRLGLVIALVTAAGLPLLGHLAFGRVGIDLVGDGYLWCGVLRTAAGELPLLDFQSYDPGRYVWCALLGEVFGTGILGVRASAAVFQALGLLCGLLAARRAVRHSAWLVPIAVILFAWSFPRHKVFEPSLAMMAVYAGVRLVERPTRGTCLAAGAFVGIAAFFGRNHGVYTLLGLLAVILLATDRDAPGEARAGAGVGQRLVAFGSGVVLGYAPMLGLLVLVPGFASAFLDSITVLGRVGINIPHPWPWPHELELAGLSPYAALEAVALSLAFLLPLVALPLGFVAVLRARRRGEPVHPLAAGATAVGLVYLHHAAVRSDASHLAQCVHPSLFALIALPTAFGRRPGRTAAVLGWLFLGTLTAVVTLRHNATFFRHRPVGRPPALVEAELAGEELRIDAPTAAYLSRLRPVVAEHVGDARLFLAPSFPALYPILGKLPPTHRFFFFVPDATPEEEERLLRELEDVDFALVVDVPVAGLEELRLARSHPRLWAYLSAEFERIPTPTLSPEHLLLRRRQRM